MTNKNGIGVFGFHENVKLDTVQFNKLEQSLGTWLLQDYIERLSDYLTNHPRRKYKCHCAVIRQWHRADVERGTVPKQPQPGRTKYGSTLFQFDDTEIPF